MVRRTQGNHYSTKRTHNIKSTCNLGLYDHDAKCVLSKVKVSVSLPSHPSLLCKLSKEKAPPTSGLSQKRLIQHGPRYHHAASCWPDKWHSWELPMMDPIQACSSPTIEIFENSFNTKTSKLTPCLEGNSSTSWASVWSRANKNSQEGLDIFPCSMVTVPSSRMTSPW